MTSVGPYNETSLHICIVLIDFFSLSDVYKHNTSIMHSVHLNFIFKVRQMYNLITIVNNSYKQLCHLM
jgi:hypothetical protein